MRVGSHSRVWPGGVTDRWEMPIHFGVPEPVQNDLGPLTRGCFGGGNLGQAKFGSIQIAPNPNLAKFEQLAHP